MSIALDSLKEDGYRLGDLQVLRYDKANHELFEVGYLGRLYEKCRESRILDALFGGNPASDFDSIVSYLAQRPLILLGQWQGSQFIEYGFAFPTVTIGGPSTERSVIAGYGFFRNSWGSEAQKVLAMLGLAYLFTEFKLLAIIGNRYPDNLLTARFMAQFGFKECGSVPRFQLRGAKLVPMVVSALMIEDFEAYVEEWLVAQLHAEMPEPVEESPVAIVEVEPAPEMDYEAQLPLSWM